MIETQKTASIQCFRTLLKIFIEGFQEFYACQMKNCFTLSVGYRLSAVLRIVCAQCKCLHRFFWFFENDSCIFVINNSFYMGEFWRCLKFLQCKTPSVHFIELNIKE